MDFGFLTVISGIVLFLIYIIGMVLAGKFFRWAYESEILPFNMYEVEFFLSSVWFFTIPIYFCFLIIYTVVGLIWLIYNKFV